MLRETLVLSRGVGGGGGAVGGVWLTREYKLNCFTAFAGQRTYQKYTSPSKLSCATCNEPKI